MQQRYVGIDLHRRRSVVLVMDGDGTTLSCVRVTNEPDQLLDAVSAAGPDAEVVIEATYGWYWAVDVLQAEGYSVHLAHPAGNDWGHRRVKNDERDARDLADLCRLGRLAEGWIAPPAVRELRELVRHRAKLVQLRSGLKAQVHAVLAKEGVPSAGELFAAPGRARLAALELAPAYRLRVDSLLGLIATYDTEVRGLEAVIAEALADHPGYRSIQAIAGVGPVLAAVFVAEIGDVARFPTAAGLCSWAGLTPRHHESDAKVRRGSITKQGSRLVRWAAVEAVTGPRAEAHLRRDYHRIAERRGKAKARVAAARKLLTLVYYGLRDGEIRCLGRPAA